MRQVDRRAEQEADADQDIPNVFPSWLAAGNQAVGRLIGAVDAVVQGVFGQEIRGSVGRGADNSPGDVAIVIRLLVGAGYLDGDVNSAIVRFQQEALNWNTPDGRIDPGGRTFKALSAGAAPRPQAAPKPEVAKRPPIPIEAGSVPNWPAILPMAKRDKNTAITLTKGDDHVTVPQIDAAELTDDQKAVVEQIKANREALPDYAIKRTKYHGNRGMVFGDSGAKEKLTPTSLRGDADDPATRARKAAFKELGHEGTVDSINTYDNQILTWGKGFSALSGSMNEVLMIMFESDPEARLELLRAGIDCSRKDWKVVNTEIGMVETGANALRLLQFDAKLLGVFVSLGRGEHQQHALDAQWAAMERNAAKVPEYAYDWDEPSIALAAHLAHWTPAFGWGVHPKTYSKTGGDLLEIAGTWARLAAKLPKWAKTLKNGAIIGPYDMMNPGHRLLGFADGAGGKAVQAAAEIVEATRDEIEEDSAYHNHVLYPVWEKKNTYYDIGTAGS